MFFTFYIKYFIQFAFEKIILKIKNVIIKLTFKKLKIMY